MTTHWDPITVGNMSLDHRLAMAPMTRSRAPSGAPTELNAEYYGQRASLGLLISEGTQPSEDGQGYIFTPGLHTDAHQAGWKLVADAVHEGGGHLFIQLMHVGRVSHPDNTSHHRQPMAPSAIQPKGQMFTLEGMKDMPEPRAMTGAEVEQTIADFADAARRAVAAGADGIEIHGANGYLVHQFLASGSNQRTDEWGGSPEKRIRFAVAVAKAVADAIGPERTGIRLSPGNPFNDMSETDLPEVYLPLVRELGALNLAYLHIMHAGDEALLSSMRETWPNTFVLNRPGSPMETRFADIAEGRADIVSIGSAALANPDLVARLKADAPLNAPDPQTFYGGDAAGYTDYPTL